MTQLKWYDLASVDLDDEPEVHDCELEPDITPWWHELVIFLKWVLPLMIAIPTALYALSEMREPLGKVWEWMGLPSW